MSRKQINQHDEKKSRGIIMTYTMAMDTMIEKYGFEHPNTIKFFAACSKNMKIREKYNNPTDTIDFHTLYWFKRLMKEEQ